MKYNSYIKPFRTLYARITMWIMLTVLVVFVIITYLVTYFAVRLNRECQEPHGDH